MNKHCEFIKSCVRARIVLYAIIYRRYLVTRASIHSSAPLYLFLSLHTLLIWRRSHLQSATNFRTTELQRDKKWKLPKRGDSNLASTTVLQCFAKPQKSLHVSTLLGARAVHFAQTSSTRKQSLTRNSKKNLAG